MLNKPFWKSKTLYLNVIYLIFVIVQENTGFLFPMQYQIVVLAVLNALNRMITNSNITLK